MHKLYYVKYTFICGKQQDGFADRYLFTKNEVHPGIYTCNTYQELFNTIKTLRNETDFECCWFRYTEPRHTVLGITIGSSVVIDGLRMSWEFNEKNFKGPVFIQVSYCECSPQYHSYDFFKRNLSMDDFMTFIHEHYKESEQYIIHD